MPVNKRSMARIGSDMAKVDATTDADIARQIAEDPDTYPEAGEAELKRGVWKIGGQVVSEAEGRAAMRRAAGRPKSANPKVHVSLRLDADVLTRYRASGPGWQRRINDALRKSLEKEPA